MRYIVPDLLTTQANRRPHQTALIDGAATVTYRQLADLAARCATLIARRTDPGARVAILLPRGVEALAAFFGAHLAAAIPVVVNDQLRPRQVAHVVSHAGAGLVLTGGRCRTLLRDTPLAADRVVDVADIREEPLSTPRPVVGKDLATLLYTSGSTGAPRGVMVSHDNLVAGAAAVAEYLHLSHRDRTLAVLPWSFDYGLNQVLATVAAGGTVAIQRSTFAADICRTLLRAEVTGMAAVPTLWSALTGDGSPFLREQLPHLRYITNSGGAMPPPALAQIRLARPNLDVYLMYGLTEAFRSTYLHPSMIDAKPGSIGTAIPNSQILVIGDDGLPCRAGEVGELVHRGPTVALGYWNDPTATAAVFRPHPLPTPATGPGEVVVFSGDYVTADHDGYLYYVGRRDEMCKSRGVRITPTEIESEILASGLAAEVVVAAIPHGDDPDPELVAVIVPAHADRDCVVDDLQAYCRTELPAHLRPHRIVAKTALPRTAHGKTDRTRIRADLDQEQAWR